MNETLFQEAEKAYADGDYHAAARGFLAVAGEEAAGAGAALHMAGNALMRLGRHDDAAMAYRHALEDEAYDRRGSVAANLGIALRASGDFQHAVEAYDEALKTLGYESEYKLHQGKAAALYELGRLDEAASSYRAAALEVGNPDPGKALNNLGLCYMTLGRPKDAVEAYRASIGMDGYAGKGRASANLGLALMALGRHEDALEAFEAATSDHGFELTGGLLEAYRVSTDAVASTMAGTMREEDLAEDVFIGIKEPESDFFTRTDAQMRELDKQSRLEERRSRDRGNLWLRVAGIVVVVGVVVVLAAWACFSGLGWPTQQATVDGLMEAHAADGQWQPYWAASLSEEIIEQEMAKLPPNYSEYSVDAVEAGVTDSKVDVTVELEGGAPLQYEFTLTREGVGWKVTGVENDWRSTGGGS